MSLPLLPTQQSNKSNNNVLNEQDTSLKTQEAVSFGLTQAEDNSNSKTFIHTNVKEPETVNGDEDEIFLLLID